MQDWENGTGWQAQRPIVFFLLTFYFDSQFLPMNSPYLKVSTTPTTEFDSYEKGMLFEQFVRQLFNEQNFNLTKWRKAEKLEDKILLDDCVNPDLELIFSRHKSHPFAVECKWRKAFISGQINWATRNQISSYKNFENRRRMPVFIAIGIGGEPSMPERLYVTPLCNIEMQTEVYESDLIPYKRKPTRKFFYDTVQLKLF